MGEINFTVPKVKQMLSRQMGRKTIGLHVRAISHDSLWQYRQTPFFKRRADIKRLSDVTIITIEMLMEIGI